MVWFHSLPADQPIRNQELPSIGLKPAGMASSHHIPVLGHICDPRRSLRPKLLALNLVPRGDGPDFYRNVVVERMEAVFWKAPLYPVRIKKT